MACGVSLWSVRARNERWLAQNVAQKCLSPVTHTTHEAMTDRDWMPMTWVPPTQRATQSTTSP
jgi:hypothetical protein